MVTYYKAVRPDGTGTPCGSPQKTTETHVTMKEADMTKNDNINDSVAVVPAAEFLSALKATLPFTDAYVGIPMRIEYDPVIGGVTVHSTDRYVYARSIAKAEPNAAASAFSIDIAVPDAKAFHAGLKGLKGLIGLAVIAETIVAYDMGHTLDTPTASLYRAHRDFPAAAMDKIARNFKVATEAPPRVALNVNHMAKFSAANLVRPRNKAKASKETALVFEPGESNSMWRISYSDHFVAITTTVQW